MFGAHYRFEVSYYVIFEMNAHCVEEFSLEYTLYISNSISFNTLEKIDCVCVFKRERSKIN